MASIMVIALIAVINSWRLYSFPTTLTIGLVAVTGTIVVIGIWLLFAAIRGKIPSRHSRLALSVLAALMLLELLLVFVDVFIW